jgi:hypothetical protein
MAHQDRAGALSARRWKAPRHLRGRDDAWAHALLHQNPSAASTAINCRQQRSARPMAASEASGPSRKSVRFVRGAGRRRRSRDAGAAGAKRRRTGREPSDASAARGRWQRAKRADPPGPPERSEGGPGGIRTLVKGSASPQDIQATPRVRIAGRPCDSGAILKRCSTCSGWGVPGSPFPAPTANTLSNRRSWVPHDPHVASVL